VLDQEKGIPVRPYRNYYDNMRQLKRIADILGSLTIRDSLGCTN
jgi:hypothetical protein